MRYVRCIVRREHQLQLYGHMARFSDADPAYQILSAREPCEWRSQRADDMPYGCSRLIDISRRWGRARLPGIFLGDGQMEALAVLVESGRSDTLLRHMLPDLTCPDQ